MEFKELKGERILTKHEYLIRVNPNHPGIPVARSEKQAVKMAVAYMEMYEDATGKDIGEVGLYHTYPSPGPVDRYVGRVRKDGTVLRGL